MIGTKARNVPPARLLGSIHCPAAAREDRDDSEGVLDLREGRYPWGFDESLAFIYVLPFTAKGDEQGFLRILSRHFDDEVKRRDAGVLRKHQNGNHCMDTRIFEHRLRALSVPELDSLHGGGRL